MESRDLVDLMKEDLEREGSYDRYPVRFFSMTYENETADILMQTLCQFRNIELFDVKKLLPHEDGWITADNLRKSIECLDPEKSFLVVGFSEYARFLSQKEFEMLIISLLEIENPAESQKRRIYFPCFALFGQMKKTVAAMHRRYENYNPFLNDNDIEDLPRMYFVNHELETEEYSNIVSSAEEWFGMWRNMDINPRRPIICLSRTLAYFYNSASPDNVYNIKQINTYQDMLRYMYNIGNLHPCQKYQEEFFGRFLKLVRRSSGRSCREIIMSELNVRSIDETNVYVLWKSRDIFGRWLIQNYILLYMPEERYLYKAMSDIEELTAKSFVQKVYELIFEIRQVSLSLERKTIIQSIWDAEGDISFSEEMVNYYNRLLCDIIKRKSTITVDKIEFTRDIKELSDNSAVLQMGIEQEILPYLTCFSNYERRLIIWLYRQKLMKAEWLKGVYPDLWRYIDGPVEDFMPEEQGEEIEEYFKIYRSCRLGQQDGKAYNKALMNWNRDESTFYRWYLDSSLEFPEVILKKQNFSGKVYVLVGVGAEFCGYLLGLLHKAGYSAVLASYGKAHLPSTTSEAQEFYSTQFQWESAYDKEIVHGEYYYPAISTEKALTKISKLLQEIMEVEGEEDFALIADHGATVGHKIRKKEKKYDFTGSEHDGRCWWNKNGEHVDPSPDYMRYDDEFGKEWIIALNQQSLYKNSKYGAHGGATPEEVLVPVIIAHKGNAIAVSYRVREVDLHVSGLEKYIKIKIYPRPRNIDVLLRAKDGTDTKMTYDNENKVWIGELKRGIEQDIEVQIGQQSFTFRTIPPTKMGDDLFDD